MQFDSSQFAGDKMDSRTSVEHVRVSEHFRCAREYTVTRRRRCLSLIVRDVVRRPDRRAHLDALPSPNIWSRKCRPQFICEARPRDENDRSKSGRPVPNSPLLALSVRALALPASECWQRKCVLGTAHRTTPAAAVLPNVPVPPETSCLSSYHTAPGRPGNIHQLPCPKERPQSSTNSSPRSRVSERW